MDFTGTGCIDSCAEVFFWNAVSGVWHWTNELLVQLKQTPVLVARLEQDRGGEHLLLSLDRHLGTLLSDNAGRSHKKIISHRSRCPVLDQSTL